MRAKIIAVDFDGTLIEEGKWPEIGATNEKVLNYCKDEQELIESQTVMDNFLIQIEEMLSHCTVVDDSVIQNYSGLVFEGAQGLLLDRDYIVFAPHLTNSKTGSYNPKKILLRNNMQNEDIEFCYVTRSYFTRHGYGPFPTECDEKSLFGKNAEEKHNHENEFQGKFRFGYFDTDRFSCACHADLAHMLDSFPKSDGVIAVTHLDETDDMICTPDGKIPVRSFVGLKYTSYGETRDCVKITEKKVRWRF